LTDADGVVANAAIDRAAYYGVAQIQIVLSQASFTGLDLCLRLQ
jgi:hypothetical protein